MTSSRELPPVNGRVSRQIQITLDLDEVQAGDLADAIGEIRADTAERGHNWRSDPAILWRLGDVARQLLARPAPGGAQQ